MKIYSNGGEDNNEGGWDGKIGLLKFMRVIKWKGMGEFCCYGHLGGVLSTKKFNFYLSIYMAKKKKHF